MSSLPTQPKPKGWLIGVGVLCITLGVIVGLIVILVVAKRKQRYRITDPASGPGQIHAAAGTLPLRPGWSLAGR